MGGPKFDTRSAARGFKRARDRSARLFRRREPDKSAPSFRPELVDGLAVVLLALAITYGIYRLLYEISTPPTAATVSRAERLELIKISLTTAGFIGLVLGAVYAYRRQRISEADAHRADSVAFTDRYTTAAEQLGHVSPAVRLAGAYAMSRLADDWHEQRQTCINVLCAYLRMPMQENEGDQEKEVRNSIQDVISRHVRPGFSRVSWSKNLLDLTGATLYSRAYFKNAVFYAADFSRVTFTKGAIFSDARFEGNAYFSGCVMMGSCIMNRVTVSGYAWFDGGQYTFDYSYWDECDFKGDVIFGGGPLGAPGATFTGERLSFGRTKFPEGASFNNCIFDASVHFSEVEFPEKIYMHGARFKRDVYFHKSKTQIHGTVYFDFEKVSRPLGLSFNVKWAKEHLREMCPKAVFPDESTDSPPGAPSS